MRRVVESSLLAQPVATYAKTPKTYRPIPAYFLALAVQCIRDLIRVFGYKFT